VPIGMARARQRISARTIRRKKCPRPRSAVGNCSLGEVDPDGREARQHGKAGNQRSGAEHDGCRRSSPMGQHHQEGAGIDSTNAPVIVHRRPMISMMYPLKSLPGMLAAKTSELSPKLKVTAAP